MLKRLFDFAVWVWPFVLVALMGLYPAWTFELIVWFVIYLPFAIWYFKEE